MERGHAARSTPSCGGLRSSRTPGRRPPQELSVFCARRPTCETCPHHGCDEGLRTAQRRRSSARVAATSGAVTPAAGWRYQCEQHCCHPLGFDISRSHTKRKRVFESNACVVCVVCSGVCVAHQHTFEHTQTYDTNTGHKTQLTTTHHNSNNTQQHTEEREDRERGEKLRREEQIK